MAALTACSVSRLSTTSRPSGPASDSAASTFTCSPRTLLGARAIKPQILGDTIHPAVEPRAWLPLLDPRQGAHTGFLDEIVGLIQVSSEGNGKAP